MNMMGVKRMVEKQLPGAEPVYMVYDKRDRLVLVQDGNLRQENKQKVAVYQSTITLNQTSSYRRF